MRRRILAALLVCYAMCARAGPVAPGPVPLTQPDGAPLDAMPYGDEWDNGYETLDGYTIVRDAHGVWTYAVRDDAGQLTPSGRIPGEASPAGIAPHLRATRTPGGPWWALSLPIVLLGYAQPGPSPTFVRTPTPTRNPYSHRLGHHSQ